MKEKVEIPRWMYLMLLLIAILNIISFVFDSLDSKPEIHIHYLDTERK